MKFIFGYLIALFVISLSYARSVDDVLCPDNETSCKITQTCCITTDGEYGCCPIPDAICCDDKIHCCPKRYT